MSQGLHAKEKDRADRLTAIVDATADGILVVDAEGRVVEANRRFIEMWRIPSDLQRSRSDEALLEFAVNQLSDPQAFMEKVDLLYGSRTEDFDTLTFKDGRVFERFSAPLLEGYDVVGRVWSFRDVTARKRTEAALIESEARSRALYHGAPVMMYSIDRELSIIEVSDFWLSQLGYTREQVIGRKFTEFLTEESRLLGEAEAFPTLQRDGHIEDLHLRFLRSDHEVRDMLLTAVAAFERGGTFSRSFSVLIDITDRLMADEGRQDLEAQLLHGQKLESLGVLAGGIAHDFNNILFSIMGNAELASVGIAADSVARTPLREIVRASERAAELCGQLLAYAGRGSFVIEPVRIADLVEDMVSLLEVSISKRVELTYDFSDRETTIEADATQLRQVVLNLVTNASEAVGDRNGSILIRTGTRPFSEAELARDWSEGTLDPGTHAFIEITDTGRGMDSLTLQRIFDPFFTTKESGRGLGLASTLGIVRGHGGALDVQSAPHRGTTFRVVLPISGESVRPTAAAEPTSVTSGLSGTILVVDDEPSIRLLAKTVLEGAFLAVLTAANGSEALRIFDENPGVISGVVLDLNMPEMSGAETLRELLRRRPNLPVILMSGHAEEAVPDLPGPESRIAFLQKPYRTRELINTLAELLNPPDPPADHS